MNSHTTSLDWADNLNQKGRFLRQIGTPDESPTTNKTHLYQYTRLFCCQVPHATRSDAPMKVDSDCSMSSIRLDFFREF